MKRIRAAGTLVLCSAAVLLALAAGCGGPSPKEQMQTYVNDCVAPVEEVNTAFATVAPALSSIATAKGPSWIAASDALSKDVRDTRTAVDHFSSITPPAPLKSAHDSLITGLKDLAQAVDQIATALKNGSYDAALLTGPALTKLLDDGGAARRAWKSVMVKQAKDLGVTIPWKWE